MNFNLEQENARLSETQSSSEDIFDGVVLHVKRDIATLPNGSSAVREVIRHIGAVCVIPVTENNEVVMERQFRYPLNRVVPRWLRDRISGPRRNAWR